SRRAATVAAGCWRRAMIFRTTNALLFVAPGRTLTSGATKSVASDSVEKGQANGNPLQASAIGTHRLWRGLSFGLSPGPVLAVGVGVACGAAPPVRVLHDDRCRVRDPGSLPVERGAKPEGSSQSDLVHRVVQCRPRCRHGSAIVRHGTP